MRHPLLRILIALLVGMASPLCCCQAALFTGDTCGPSPVVVVFTPEAAPTPAAPSRCCSSAKCHDEQPPATSPTNSDTDNHNSPAHTHNPSQPCDTCPTCYSTIKQASIDNLSSSTLNAFAKQYLCSDAAFPTLVELLRLELHAKQPQAYSQSDDAHIRPNRAALRWHCALIV